ncbi:MAG TPA: VOC family protein [Burkholderiaceae bacterium]|nr:VOC family protein [Burkholderiaceae bacterium]
MPRQIFVNLPVKNLERSKAFFSALGYSFNPKFTDEKAACMIIGENIHAMLLSEPFFQTFISKRIADATQTTEVLIALNCDSRAEVEDMVAKAVQAGGRPAREAKDHGFMYEHAFEDLDGHIWEVFWMDPGSAQ